MFKEKPKSMPRTSEPLFLCYLPLPVAFSIFFLLLIGNKGISLSSYIRQTRILAKFCGLLVVWPYSTQPLTPTLLPSPSAAYSKPSQSGGSGIQLVKETKLASLPILDLVMLLCDDAKNGNLAQTLPWVVEFLTMLKCIYHIF